MALTDLTRISTAGIATGTSLSGAILHGDAHFRGTNAGINSAIFDSSENELNLKDNVKLTFGDKSSGDMMIYHDGSHSHIFDNGTGDLRLTTGGQKIDFQKTGGEVLARFHTDGAVELRHDNSIKFQTTESGSIVTGILTATGFSGPLSNASGISTFYNLRVSNNLTVEGTTTTLDTNVTGVDRLEINANSNTNTAIVGIQSGTADIVNLFDGTTEVLTVKDGGDVGIGSEIPSEKLDVNGNIKASGKITAYDATSTSNQVRARIKATASDDDGRVGVYYGNTEIAALFGKWSGSAFSTGLNLPFEPFVVTGSSGAERLRITSDGKIGIGTDDPNGQFHIHQSSAGSVTAATDANDLVIESSTNVGMSLLTANNSQARIKFGDPDATNAGAFVYNHTNDKFSIVTGTGNRMIIGADMISGRTDYALARTVGGYTFRETNEGNERAGMHSNASNHLIFKTAAAVERLRIESGGDVGVGTDNALARLDVYKGTSATDVDIFSVRSKTGAFNIQCSDTDAANPEWRLRTYSNEDLVFSPGGTGSSAEKVRITSAGLVGIGTDNPADILHLRSTAPILKVDATNNQSGLRIDILGQTGGSNNQLFRVQRDAIIKFQINDDGDVVITGDDNSELKLKAGTSTGNDIIAFLNSSGTTKGQIFYDTDDNFMVFKTNGTASSNERLRIDSSGRLLTGGATSSQGSTNSDDLQIGANDQANQTGITLGSASASGIRFADAASDTAGAISYYHSDDTMRFTTGATGEKLRITSNGNVDINGTPPWTVTGGNYRNLSISGEGASASGFLWLGNGASATNADFDLTRINICNGANIVAQITGTTDTSDNDTGRLVFYTRKNGDSSPSKRLSINSTGGLQIFTNTGTHPNVSATASNHTGSFTSAGLVLSTPAYNEYHFTWSGQSSYTIDFTCGSYFHSEFVYVQHQTNGGHHMHHYVRGKWANNHYTHTGFIYEHSGNGGACSTAIECSDQSGGGTVDMKGGLTEAGSPGASYRARYGGGHEGSSTTANGRLRFTETYGPAGSSVATRGVILKIYYGSLTGASIS